MGLTIKRESDNYILCSCENIINLWNIIKYISVMPYLKKFIIKNYEGGNTMVPISVWESHEVYYKQLDNNTILLPYEHIDFLFSDNIHNVDIYIIDTDKPNDINEAEMYVSIKNTDNLMVRINKDKITTFISLYFMSFFNISVNNIIIDRISNLIKNRIYEEYHPLKNSLFIIPSFFSFIVISKIDNKEDLFKIEIGDKDKLLYINKNSLYGKLCIFKKKLFKNKLLTFLFCLISFFFYFFILFLLFRFNKSFSLIFVSITLILIIFKSYLKKTIKNHFR